MKILGVILSAVSVVIKLFSSKAKETERKYRIFKEMSKSDEERDDAEIDRLRHSDK